MTKQERYVKRRRLNLLGYKALAGIRTPEEDAEAQRLMDDFDRKGKL